MYNKIIILKYKSININNIEFETKLKVQIY